MGRVGLRGSLPRECLCRVSPWMAVRSTPVFPREPLDTAAWEQDHQGCRQPPTLVSVMPG